MTPSRPYLIRAIYEWILDNSLTPYLAVDATQDNVSVPMAYVKDGQVVLDLSPSAVRELHISNDVVTFDARFGGQPHNIYVPIKSVMAMYAAENGRGMVFGQEDPLGGDDDSGPDGGPDGRPDGGPNGKSGDSGSSKNKKKSHLKIVK